MQAQELWYGDPDKSVGTVFGRFDSGNYPTDDCSGGNGSAVSTVGTVTDPVYGKVWRIHKPNKRKRGEFARTSYIPSDGQTLYYGWRWKIEATPDITGGIAVFQWKTDAGGGNNSQNYPLNMGYGGGKLSMNAYGPCYPNWNSCPGSINNRMIQLWNKPVNEGEWVTIVIKLKLSTNKDVGEVELWFNGEKQILSNNPANDYSINLSTDKKTAYHKTFDGAVTYPKWGAYNGEACNYDVYTYFDEMRIGTTLASVLDPMGGGTVADVTNINVPSSVQQGQNVNISVDYNTSENRDLVVMFQLDQSPWTIYKEVRKSINSGAGSINIPIMIPSTTPIANNAYQFQVYMAPTGGVWENRLSNKEKKDVSVTGTLSGESFDLTNFAVSPNPSKDGIFHLSESVNFEVYDLLGHKVLSNKGKLIDLSSNPQGIYLLNVDSKKIKLIR
jgi:hypothetical protein